MQESLDAPRDDEVMATSSDMWMYLPLEEAFCAVPLEPESFRPFDPPREFSAVEKSAWSPIPS